METPGACNEIQTDTIIEMRTMKRNLRGWCFTLFAGVLLVAPQVRGANNGGTVAWGTSASFDPLAFHEDGSVDNAQNLWTLGWFNDGYVPDALNWDSWAANWNPVSSPVSEDDPLDPTPPYDQINFPVHRKVDGLWGVSVNTYDVGSAAVGKQMYVFAYNDLTKIGTPDGEALLYRQDDFYFPGSPTQATFDIEDNPLNSSDDNLTVIWGRVDRAMYDIGGVLTGGGLISVEVPDSDATPLAGTFEAQFATWAVVPEPSAALLGGLGMLLLLRRRR